MERFSCCDQFIAPSGKVKVIIYSCKAVPVRIWIIDSKNNIIWHNGGTGNYNSYLGFNPETGTAVVVLSNLAPNYRVPATVLGVKLLLELDNEK